jgi:hypothetical protein
MDQITFSEAAYQNKKPKTCREIFLERMDKLILRKQLEKKVACYYHRGQNSRPPYPLSVMMRIHCMQLSVLKPHRLSHGRCVARDRIHVAVNVPVIVAPYAGALRY